jgi:hypothetical protein
MTGDRLDKIRARHRRLAVDDDPLCLTCLNEYLGDDDVATWPCDYGYLINLLAERDARIAALEAALTPIVAEFTGAGRCTNCGKSIEACRCVIDLARAALAGGEES